MLPNTKEVFERIKNLYGFKNLTELSKYFGKNGNWAASMNKNDSVPYPQCFQTSTEKQVSMDWLLLGEDKQSIEKNVLLNEIQEGLYECNELEIFKKLSVEQLKAASVVILKKLENEIKVSKTDIGQQNTKAI